MPYDLGSARYTKLELGDSNQMSTLKKLALTVAASAMMGTALADGSTLEQVQARGELNCGVSTGLAGFAYTDENGAWKGFDVAVCDAVAAAYHHAQAQGFWFAHQRCTGAHQASAEAVASGEADIAAIDAMTWRMICRYDDFSEQLRVLDWTQATPGLPLITALRHPPEVLFQAVVQAIAALTPEDRDTLGLRDIVMIPKDAYLAVPNPPEQTSKTNFMG